MAARKAIVTVAVSPINDDPIANDDGAATDEDTAVTIDVLANDSDVDGDILSVDSVTQGGSGAVTNNGSDVTYTPNTNSRESIHSPTLLPIATAERQRQQYSGCRRNQRRSDR